MRCGRWDGASRERSGDWKRCWIELSGSASSRPAGALATEVRLSPESGGTSCHHPCARLRTSRSLLEDAIELIEGRDTISTSFVQRQLRIGFPRAARLVDQLEERGLVGPDEGGGRGRKVLVGRGIDFDEIDERLPGVEPS